MSPFPDAFYSAVGEGCYESTIATAGPWSDKTQHGGPPSALLAREIERCSPREGFRVARITVEMPRPIPVGVLQAEVRIVRSGGRSELLEGALTSEGQPLLFARAWRIASSPADTPALRPVSSPPPLFPKQPTPDMAGAFADGYIMATEWRFGPGESWDSRGPGTAWARPRIPLIAGEAGTPLTRALIVADSSWAVGFELDYTSRMVINTDLTVALHRDPAGEWMCVRTAWATSPNGSGLAAGQLDDEQGDCGRILQTILIAKR